MTLPNGPKTSAFIQIMQWIVTPMSFMEDCAKRYGDMFTVRFAGGLPPLVYVSNPQVLQEILTGDSTKQFSAPGKLNTIFEPLVGKSSVFTLNGIEHQRQRQLLTPPFHGDRMRSYSKVINHVTEEVISQYQIGKPFNIRSATQLITLRTIMQAAFGLYEGERAQQMEELLGIILDNISSLAGVAILYFPVLQTDLGAWSPWGKYIRQQRKVDEIIYKEIRERREQPDASRTDILSLLMSARDEAGESMSDEELRDQLVGLLIAGHETTATALSWALYWIHQLPAVRQKLLQELDSLGENPDETTISKLPYLNAVCCETLRIYPVAMLTLPREVETRVTLDGYELEPGTVLLGSIYLAHHREDLYPEPKKFKPERFLEKQFSPYEFLPFGGGVRRCIGSAFALFEMKLALAKILSRYSLALVDETEVKPRRRGLVTAPSRPIEMVVTGKRKLESRSLEAVSG